MPGRDPSSETSAQPGKLRPDQRRDSDDRGRVEESTEEMICTRMVHDVKALETTVKELDVDRERAVLEQVLRVRDVDVSSASQRQVPTLQTSAVQPTSGGRIRDHRAEVQHDPEGPERSEFHRCRS